MARDFLRPHAPRVAFSMLWMAVAAAMTGALAWLMQPVIDGIFAHRDKDQLYWVAAAVFAAAVMVLVGLFQVGAGLVALLNDEFYVIAPNYTYDIDVTAWGWVHLVIGVIVFLGGIGLFSRKPWAGMLAIFLALLSAFANFFFIPYYPFWTILEIALAVWVIWALTRPGVLRF